MWDAVAVAVGLVLYGLVAARLDRWSITGPMACVGIGILLGPAATGLLRGAPEEGSLLLGAELTLACLLFTDAATVGVRRVEADAGLPARLLGLGLPMTIGLGAALARLLCPGLDWAAAALIGAILAPTDAALGMAVVANRAVPARIRQALNVESGLNDGIVTPFVTLFLILTVSAEGVGQGHPLAEAAGEIGIALAVAVLAGAVGGLAVSACHQRGWTNRASEELILPALALGSYLAAVAAGGNGFVAAFVAGLLFGSASRGRADAAVEFSEGVTVVTSLLVWTMFGALLAGPVLTHDIDVRIIVYAVLSLTVIRMLPVALALAGAGLRRDSVLFIGWFGPRGLASVVFLLVSMEELAPDALRGAVVGTVTWTVLLSVVLHGASAGPAAAGYGRRLAQGEPAQDSSAAEEADASTTDFIRHAAAGPDRLLREG
jgi:NhaP-type Na+/H+ or K+/H+ antiporter